MQRPSSGCTHYMYMLVDTGVSTNPNNPNDFHACMHLKQEFCDDLISSYIHIHLSGAEAR